MHSVAWGLFEWAMTGSAVLVFTLLGVIAKRVESRIVRGEEATAALAERTQAAELMIMSQAKDIERLRGDIDRAEGHDERTQEMIDRMRDGVVLKLDTMRDESTAQHGELRSDMISRLDEAKERGADDRRRLHLKIDESHEKLAVRVDTLKDQLIQHLGARQASAQGGE